MAKNPQITRSCEENVVIIIDADVDADNDADTTEDAFKSLIDEVVTVTGQRNHLNTIPTTDDTTNIDAAMKLVATATTDDTEVLDLGVGTGSVCHYKPIKF
jgi:hypothetical protein